MSASSELEPHPSWTGIGGRHSLVPQGGEGTAWRGLRPVATTWGLTRRWSGTERGYTLAVTVGGLTTG